VFAAESRQRIITEAAALSTLSTVLVVALLWFAYRSVRTLLLGLVPVACGVLAGFAAVGAGFGYVHGVTLAFGVTMIGEAVDYAVLSLRAGRRRPRPGDGRRLATAPLADIASWHGHFDRRLRRVAAVRIPGLAQPGCLPLPD